MLLSRLRKKPFDLDSSQVRGLLKIGLRPLAVREDLVRNGHKDAVGGLALTPTWDGRDRLAKFARTEWEGSHMALVVYRRSGTLSGEILVGPRQVQMPEWKQLSKEVSDALGFQVSLRAD